LEEYLKRIEGNSAHAARDIARSQPARTGDNPPDKSVQLHLGYCTRSSTRSHPPDPGHDEINREGASTSSVSVVMKMYELPESLPVNRV
jgi:hypothetical protein